MFNCAGQAHAKIFSAFAIDDSGTLERNVKEIRPLDPEQVDARNQLCELGGDVSLRVLPHIAPGQSGADR